MKKIKKFYCYIATICLSFFVTLSVKAGPVNHPLMTRLRDTASKGENAPYAEDTSISTLADILGSLIYWFLTLLGAIFLGFMIFAGFLWLTARGNKEQVDKARTIMVNAITGLAIILAGAAITSLIYLVFIT